jgi:hypothetical protein
MFHDILLDVSQQNAPEAWIEKLKPALYCKPKLSSKLHFY